MAMRPFTMPTSQRRRGMRVPSTTMPPLMTVSYRAIAYLRSATRCPTRLLGRFPNHALLAPLVFARATFVKGAGLCRSEVSRPALGYFIPPARSGKESLLKTYTAREMEVAHDAAVRAGLPLSAEGTAEALMKGGLR